jgi:hypothetical protein
VVGGQGTVHLSDQSSGARSATPERGPGLGAQDWDRDGRNHDIGRARGLWGWRASGARESCKSVETSCDDLELARKITSARPGKVCGHLSSPNPRKRLLALGRAGQYPRRPPPCLARPRWLAASPPQALLRPSSSPTRDPGLRYVVFLVRTSPTRRERSRLPPTFPAGK